MKKPHPLIGKRYHVATTDDLFEVISVNAESVICRYRNKDKPDVPTTITALDKVVKLEVWKEITT